ncbi:hypothetical protein L5515_014697 [Caenorhabditis briggsae]|uniref:ShKT domain-containing protein n=1 Tax=Caenorhabditis briggsae TaxID=6238 RepID=A0AAE9EGY5_CAEBR|nr:hypothetical protein L5515_014697 [Caenorhabditis briggsae]
MKKLTEKWLNIFLMVVHYVFEVDSQLRSFSNVGNIVMEQDPRDQDPFYRNYYARAEGMSLAAVNSVVHNVKHQSEGQFTIWDELPSHRVRPGYTTTTKRPKTTTTTVPWVRGRHRPQLGQQQAPWYQNDPDKYDNGYGTDYDDDAYRPPSRTRGRRPTGSRGRRPPAPTAPVRVQVGKGDELVENEDGGGFAAIEEGVKADVDAEGLAKPEEGMKMVTTTEKPTTQTVAKTTATTKKILVKKKEKEDESEGSKDEVPYPDDHGYTHSMTPTTPTHPAETIGVNDEDLKKIRKNTEPQENGIDCSTAVDEFPLKCGAWKSAGFCETNQATQFLWCRKTCICSLMHIRTTSTSSPNSRE